MFKRLILANAVMSVTQVLVISIILFFLYRFLIKTIGVEQFGVWSLLLATTSIVQIANLGFSGGVIKFVAKYDARKDYINISKVIQTAAISIFIVVNVILLVFYPFIEWIIKKVLPTNYIIYVLDILPLALLNLLLVMIYNVFNSAIDGLQKIYLRNILTMLNSIFFAILCFVLTPSFGLAGLVFAQVLNSFIMLILSWVTVKKMISMLPVLPFQWDKIIFKEIIIYSINFQIISITTMCYDPITKLLLSKFGGINMVSYYEMASKMVQQFRAILLSANQVLVPSIANLYESNPQQIKAIYLNNYNLLFYLSLPLYTFIIIVTPYVSKLWIGYYESTFMMFSVFLSIGHFLNTLAGPSYFAYLGVGILRWNLTSHILIAIFNILFGIVLGWLFNGYGVVIAWVIALSMGSAIIYISYHISNKIPLLELFPKDSKVMTIVCITILFMSIIFQYVNVSNFNEKINMCFILIGLIILFVVVYIHPLRKRLYLWFMDSLINKKL